MSATSPATAPLDLARYLERIELAGPLQSSPAGLSALHRAHATHIPFENLDILLGQPVRLDLASLQAKLVTRRRGGYCFEHNLLFAEVLRHAGFEVTMLSARVRYRASAPMARTHMLLRVDLDGTRWLADVGFGAEGLLDPIPYGSEAPVRQGPWTYRVVREGPLHILQSLRRGTWIDLYAFTEEAQLPIDYEVANHFTSTHPDSRFVRTLFVQSVRTDARYALHNRDLVIDRGDAVETTSGLDDGALVDVLGREFGLTFPRGTRFRCPGLER